MGWRVVRAERREEVLDVVADAVAGQPERGADVSVFVGVEALEDFGLPRGQARQHGSTAARQHGGTAARRQRQPDGPAASVVEGRQPEDTRAADGVPPVVHAERREEVLDVVADAVAGQPERGADVSVFVGVEAREDFGLPRGQPRRQRQNDGPAAT